MEERGFKVEFAEGEARVLLQNNEIVLKGKRKGRLYVVEEEKSVAYATKTTINELWHHRLGHPSQSLMKNFESKNENKKEPNKPCSVCIQAGVEIKKI